METPDAIAQYTRREQVLLEHLREAQIAATVGDLPGVLDAQSKVYATLSSIIGEQTQQVLRVVYG
ncbi:MULTISPECIES: hypothetical protein [Thiothrix]|jgi:hypothetical protein|uniref:hypothetical protein n=1 Tax=Thiothrix TaxID=1030 RepID=UPI00257F451D|nr:MULTISPECIES: hypothetical protein [Thiothrix]MDX9987391.1 hypothetical protein [Thiothrix unzii]